MTVLSEYQRLESEGIWRPDPDAQRRDVVVSVGDATLVLIDMSGTALAHWSLPAVDRLNPGETPALYAPGPEATDTLEIADPEMIDAIERVRRVISRGRSRPGRMRAGITAGVVAFTLGLALFWLPGALGRYAATILPPAAVESLGESLMGHVTDLTGAACDAPAGRDALAALERRLFPDGRTRLRVLPSGLGQTAHLPGGYLVLGRAVVEDHETPEAVAGFVLAEAARRAVHDPVERLLDDAGLSATLGLLTTGQLSDAALRDHAERLVAAPHQAVPLDVLLDRFAAAQISPAPYAYALDISGESTIGLVEGATLTETAAPVLKDGQWLALQAICEA